MSEIETTSATAVEVIPQKLLDAISQIHEFCKEKVAGCANCPLFAGMPGESTGCIYQNLVPAEVSAQKIIDMNYRNAPPEKNDSLPAVGSKVVIGGASYVVLDYDGDSALVLLNRLDGYREFGNDADYENSSIREYLNGAYYSDLAEKIGAENIVKHRVNLEAEDGSGKDYFVEDYVSIISLPNARKYVDLLPREQGWYWTTAKKSWIVGGYEDTVCVINTSGMYGEEDSYQDNGGVRPFCVIKASVLASKT